MKMELLGMSKVATSTVHFLYKDATATKICSNSAMKPTGLELAVRRKFPNIKYAINYLFTEYFLRLFASTKRRLFCFFFDPRIWSREE